MAFNKGDRVRHKDGLVMTVISSNERTTWSRREPKDVEVVNPNYKIDKWLCATANLTKIEPNEQLSFL